MRARAPAVDWQSVPVERNCACATERRAANALRRRSCRSQRDCAGRPLAPRLACARRLARSSNKQPRSSINLPDGGETVSRSRARSVSRPPASSPARPRPLARPSSGNPKQAQRRAKPALGLFRPRDKPAGALARQAQPIARRAAECLGGKVSPLRRRQRQVGVA